MKALAPAALVALMAQPVLAEPGSADSKQTVQSNLVSPGQDIVIKTDRPRDAKNIALVAGLAGVGVIFGGVGLYYHLDSRTNSNAVSPDRPTNEPWTPADQAKYDDAHSSAIKAGVFYGLGGAAIISSVVLLIVTDPGQNETAIHPHVTPTPGGAMFGGTWSF
ncbi:MAG: hypothetical protein QM831_27750 [Kofleriaceae bacterium]